MIPSSGPVEPVSEADDTAEVATKPLRCSYCRTKQTSQKVKICPACGAVRKKNRWQSPRERLRHDIIIALLETWLILVLITISIWVVLYATSSSSTSTKTPAQICRDAGVDPRYC